ncbi:MAG: class I tRNA ligase family protein, partial [Coriobacteriia bacterium]|nr:class I tRNA ligase family protein [Coriobacteriia bacterium]
MSNEPFYLTTPIYYVNGTPHIGTAYTTIAADTIARFQRLRGRKVHFLTGMDEHGQKVAQAAAEHDMTPQEWCDSQMPQFTDLWRDLDISNDDFIRTTQERHVRGVRKFLQTLFDNGYLYKDSYEGLYCTPCETFFAEDDLVDGKCPDCGRAVESIKEDNWFFKLSAFGDKLIEYYESHPDFIRPEIRRNEVMSFVKGGLRDLSISRSTFDWGVPLPFDEEHVTYVWVDALINYLTALGYGSDDESLFETFWPANFHFVGKDIIRFHCVIWPAMLMAAGMPLPEYVFAHGFLMAADGSKMSKS